MLNNLKYSQFNEGEKRKIFFFPYKSTCLEGDYMNMNKTFSICWGKQT